MKVIEPSEILVEGDGTIREEATRVNPWLRLLARSFDYSLFFFLLWFLRVITLGFFPLGQYEHLIPFEFFLWIPVEAFLLSQWGTTPGKLFLRIQLKRQGGKGKLDFRSALKRSFDVWFRGLGMGIPIINFFCLLVAYQRLRLFRQTSWDRDSYTAITHLPIGKWRLVLATLVAALGFLLYSSNKSRVLQETKPSRRNVSKII